MTKKSTLFTFVVIIVVVVVVVMTAPHFSTLLTSLPKRRPANSILYHVITFRQ